MYMPFLRGKQYDLLALRDIADDIANSSSIVPIIEPVRLTNSAKTSIGVFCESGMRFALIVNPQHGDAKGNADAVRAEIVDPILSEYDNYVPTLFVDSHTKSAAVKEFLRSYDDLEVGFVHAGSPTDGKVLELISQHDSTAYNIIYDGKVAKKHIEALQDNTRVILRDNFDKATRNADYPDDDFFTDLHTQVPSDSYIGFADFSIAGDEYSDDGGAAYAVAIHHVYGKAKENDVLHVRHFVSDSNATTKDPAGKYAEALTKLVTALPSLKKLHNANNTATCGEYASQHRSQTFRGLGYVKRLAIRHHIQVMLELLNG